MNSKGNSVGTRKHLRVVLAAMLLVGVSLPSLGQSPSASPAISLPVLQQCGWPFKTTPETLNVMYPDANAVYWTTLFVMLPGSKLEVDGSFFQARFLSLNTYNALGESLTGTHDTDFSLDSGSENPYLDPSASGGNFHATIIPPPAGGGVPAPGILYGPPLNKYGFSQGYVVLRAYIPGFSVAQQQLPDITVKLNGRTLGRFPPCQQLSPSIRLLAYTILVRFWNGKFSAPGGGTAPPEAEFFPPQSAGNGAFPNEFNKYVVAVAKYQKGRIVVVRGKAPTFPSNGPNGYPLLAGQNLRYWSLCNYDYVFPYPVVQGGCAADFQTPLDPQGYYTYVIATPNDTPQRAKSDETVTILPWGSRLVENALILRNMLPDPSFTQTAQTANTECTGQPTLDDSAKCTAGVMGSYYPQATYCEKSVYESGGWQACFNQ